MSEKPISNDSQLQMLVRDVLDRAPETRNFYDRQLQSVLKTKGKPLYDIQRGKSKNPDRNTLKAISQILNIDQTAIEAALNKDGYSLFDSQVEKDAGGWAHLESRRISDQPRVRDASEGETVPIASLDLSYSMGPGTHIDGYIEENPVEMDIGFLRRITRSEFTRLRLARGVGDSMFPTLLTSDVVLIDTTQNQLSKQDSVYAISLYGAAAIKRLRRVGADRILVKSDNPAVDDQEVDAHDVHIDGRVIWFGRDL